MPATFYAPEMHVVCLTRAQETAPPDVAATLVCYSSDKPSPMPPPPPPPFQPRSAFDLAGELDEVTGEFSMPLMDCVDFFGVVAVDVTMSVQLDKGGGPASGTVTVTEDFTAPLDCADGTQSSGPLTLTPLAQSHDEDLDGCTDWEELGDNEMAGGLRDPFNFWDFYDVPTGTWPNLARDGAVTAQDLFAVQARFGAEGDPEIDPLSPPPAPPAYHPAYDRGSPALGPDIWNLPPADGAIAAAEIFAVIAQFGHDCQPAP